MAKESMKARERKRARMVELQKDKRAALKAAGDWTALKALQDTLKGGRPPVA